MVIEAKPSFPLNRTVYVLAWKNADAETNAAHIDPITLRYISKFCDEQEART
jgi:hypothetical protein